MDTDRQWVIVRIDGKIAAISTDFRALAAVAARIAKDSKPKYELVTAQTVTFEQVWNLRQTAVWEDFILFGTDFQKRVWRKLYELTHLGEKNDFEEKMEGKKTSSGGEGEIGGDKSTGPDRLKLLSYSDFAELCENRAGVRAVAHAVGLNPLAVVIPCHLVVPKEAIDRIREIRRKAEDTIFKGDDLCLDKVLRDPSTDFGEYGLGRRLKRELIVRELLSV